jgi:hypothetical protein
MIFSVGVLVDFDNTHSVGVTERSDILAGSKSRETIKNVESRNSCTKYEKRF